MAYCGLDCEKCDAYIATQTDNEELRVKTAALWSELNQVPITTDMISCDGCRAVGRKTPYCESMCPIRSCAVAKQYETCGDCPDMNSCKDLQNIINSSPRVKDNLKGNNAK